LNLVTLYLLLLKATLTSFTGTTSLPIVREDFVVERRLISDAQLTRALAISRATPGPFGLYLVVVGYFAAGVPGAAAGGLALITPAFLVLVLLRTLGSRADRDDVKQVIRGVILAGAGLSLATMIPLARDALPTPASTALALASFAALAFTKVDTLWVVVGATVAGVVLP
jgi:chromate transporter